MANYSVEGEWDEHQQVARIKAVPEGAHQECNENLVFGNSRVHGKSKPLGGKYVPVIYELLQASRKLIIEYTIQLIIMLINFLLQERSPIYFLQSDRIGLIKLSHSDR